MIYYVANKNAQNTGEHEIHAWNCEWLPQRTNQVKLGDFNKCEDALQEARRYFRNVDGCFYCCNACHTK